jgi:FkbM family methyltransferase
MLRDRLIDTAIKIGVDGQLRNVRSLAHPVYRRQREDDRKLHHLFRSVLRDDSNCIDIGAYRGRVLAEIVKAAPKGHHIAYEPSPHMYARLLKRFPSVDVRQAAVSNRSGWTTFSYVASQPGLSGFRDRAIDLSRLEHLKVLTECLDESLPSGFVPTLMKVDVEGAEREVFEGAMETIVRHKPTIVFEHGRAACHFGTYPHHIYDLLHDQAKLDLFDLDGNGPYSLNQFEESFERDERWDYVARNASAPV